MSERVCHLKDKLGRDLHIGDVVIAENLTFSDKPDVLHYMGSSKNRKPPFATEGIFVDNTGWRTFIPSDDDGIVQTAQMKWAFNTSKPKVLTGAWVQDAIDGHQCVVCSRCGSPIPIQSDIDNITTKDNRYCYFCGANMTEV